MDHPASAISAPHILSPTNHFRSPSQARQAPSLTTAGLAHRQSCQPRVEQHSERRASRLADWPSNTETERSKQPSHPVRPRSRYARSTDPQGLNSFMATPISTIKECCQACQDTKQLRDNPPRLAVSRCSVGGLSAHCPVCRSLADLDWRESCSWPKWGLAGSPVRPLSFACWLSLGWSLGPSFCATVHVVALSKESA